jgi:uncharacterized membrane protein
VAKDIEDLPTISDHGRVEAFKQEIADMKVRDPATGRDRAWLRIGIALMVVGLAVSISAYFQSHGTTNPLSQRDALTIGMAGISTTIIGAALFLRYSIANFLRFWLARFSYEQQAQTDRIVERLDRH